MQFKGGRGFGPKNEGTRKEAKTQQRGAKLEKADSSKKGRQASKPRRKD